MKMNKFAPTTILALQAAIAISLCFVIGDFFQLERAYWAVLTSLLLISQTWGESLKKAFERISMTILGGVVGTFIYFFIAGHTYVIFAFLIFVIFFVIWCLGYSFRASAFFVTIFLVFLFAILGKWSVHMLVIRIYETMIGAAIAVITSLIVFPTHPKSNLQILFKEYLENFKNVINLGFEISLNEKTTNLISLNRDILHKSFIKINDSYQTSNFRMQIPLFSRKQTQVFITEFGYMAHYATNLLEVSAYVDFSKLTSSQLEQLKSIHKGFLQMIDHIIKSIISNDAFQIPETINQQLLSLNETILNLFKNCEEHQKDLLNDFSFIYYLQKLIEIFENLKIE